MTRPYRIYLAPIILFLLYSCSQKDNNFYYGDEHNGNIKSIQQKQYKVKDSFGELEKGSILRDSYHHFMLFDESGYLIEEVFYDGRSNIESKNVFNYDEDHNLQGIKIYGENMKLDSYIKKVEDNEYNYLIYDSENNLIRKRKVELASNGKWGEIYNYENDTLSSTETINYNSNNSVTKKIIDYISFSVCYLYEYNEQGLYMGYKNCDNENYNSKFRYIKFDSLGNWILRAKFFGDEPYAMEERTIIFF